MLGHSEPKLFNKELNILSVKSLRFFIIFTSSIYCYLSDTTSIIILFKKKQKFDKINYDSKLDLILWVEKTNLL